MEELALQMAVKQTYKETGGWFRPWAVFGKGMHMGEIILMEDSDKIVPKVSCFFSSTMTSHLLYSLQGFCDATRKMAVFLNLIIIDYKSDIMQVVNHFTRRINRCILMMCVNKLVGDGSAIQFFKEILKIVCFYTAFYVQIRAHSHVHVDCIPH